MFCIDAIHPHCYGRVEACDSVSTSADGPAVIEVWMHDEPAENITEVNIEVIEVRVNREDEGEGWETISEPNEIYNLLDLTNGNMVLLGEEEIEPGYYSQIRLVLGENNSVVLNDGEVLELKTPSAQQSGLKIKLDAEIEPDIVYSLALDFDVNRSLVRTGNSPNQDYILKPVIRAYERALTGTISGTVLPAESFARVEAIVADTVYTTTFAAEDGDFQLLGLEPQAYSLNIEATRGNYEPTSIDNVEVAAGEDTSAGEIILEPGENGDE